MSIERRSAAGSSTAIPAEAALDRACEGRHDFRIAALGHVEAHERRRGLRRTEHIARREHDLLVERRPRDMGGVAAVRQAAPEIETTARGLPSVWQPLNVAT